MAVFLIFFEITTVFLESVCIVWCLMLVYIITSYANSLINVTDIVMSFLKAMDSMVENEHCPL